MPAHPFALQELVRIKRPCLSRPTVLTTLWGGQETTEHGQYLLAFCSQLESHSSICQGDAASQLCALHPGTYAHSIIHQLQHLHGCAAWTCRLDRTGL